MIHTDSKLINTDLLHADLTYRVRGAIFTVYNTLGYGHKESVYQKALSRELSILEIPYKTEFPLNVTYRGERVGNYRPDFLINEKLILEIKATDLLPKTFEMQLLNYLKTTGFTLGMLVNFGAPKIFIKRFIWTPKGSM